jgi:hypothetical protein
MIVVTNLITVSEAASRLGIDRDAVLMAVGRGSLKVSESLKAPSGAVIAHLFDPVEVERYAKENLGKRGRKPSDNKLKKPKT